MKLNSHNSFNYGRYSAYLGGAPFSFLSEAECTVNASKKRDKGHAKVNLLPLLTNCKVGKIGLNMQGINAILA